MPRTLTVVQQTITRWNVKNVTAGESFQCRNRVYVRVPQHPEARCYNQRITMPDFDSLRSSLADLAATAKTLGMPFAQQTAITSLLPFIDNIEMRASGILPSCSIV